MSKKRMIQQVERLVKTESYPHNETGLDDWINEGDIKGMTAEQIAQEWDELNAKQSTHLEEREETHEPLPVIRYDRFSIPE